MELVMDKKEKNKLTDEENRKLIRAYRETGDEYYKEKFFVKNDRLCFHMAQKYLNTRLPLEELVSLARFGMLKAFNTFDLEKDTWFATYASRCMLNEIFMFLRKNKKHSGVASLEERTNVNKDGKELTLLDIIEGESSYDIDRMVMREGISHLFKELRKTLSELEYDIIVNLISDNYKKQRKIAEEWGLTQSYISRVGNRAIRKARKIASRLGLGDVIKFNTTYDPKKKYASPVKEKKEEESPVITYHIRELVDMECPKKKEKVKAERDITRLRKGVFLFLIQKGMTQKRMTQKEIADVLGISQAAVNGYYKAYKNGELEGIEPIDPSTVELPKTQNKQEQKIISKPPKKEEETPKPYEEITLIGTVQEPKEEPKKLKTTYAGISLENASAEDVREALEFYLRKLDHEKKYDVRLSVRTYE